mmetsp:Transcript_13309/g.28653  ORF Transcript_13309/g.28653 Transcript_13309/m.28653 type:complete len:212 (+) Transcript_13309:132-767(+)
MLMSHAQVIHSLLTEPNHTCMVESPAYEPLAATASAAAKRGSEAVVQLRRECQDGSFQFDSALLLEELRQRRPRLVVLTNPHNPTGRLVRNLPEIMKHVEEHNKGLGAQEQCYVLVDEVMREAVSATTVAPAATLSAFAISSFSATKAFGLSGLRMGVLLASPQVVRCVVNYSTLVGAANSAYLEQFWIQFWRNRGAALEPMLDLHRRRMR